MRAIGLVLLSIAIMALLLTDADAKQRSSAQGSQAAGASRSWCAVHPRHGGENCGYTSFDQCWATIGAEGGWCRPNPFPGTPAARRAFLDMYACARVMGFRTEISAHKHGNFVQ